MSRGSGRKGSENSQHKLYSTKSICGTGRSSVSGSLPGCSGLLGVKFYCGHTCLETLGADLHPGQRDVRGWGWRCSQAPFLPCKGKTAGAARGRQQRRGGSEHPFHLPAAEPAWAGDSAPLCCCSLHTPAWLGGDSRPTCGFPTDGFSGFFVPNRSELHRGVLVRKAGVCSQRCPPSQDKTSARTRQGSLSWQYSHPGAEPRPGLIFWEKM